MQVRNICDFLLVKLNVQKNLKLCAPDRLPTTTNTKIIVFKQLCIGRASM